MRVENLGGPKFKIGDLVLYRGQCVGTIRLLRQSRGSWPWAYVEFHWPTVWYHEVETKHLHMLSTLEALAVSADGADLEVRKKNAKTPAVDPLSR